MQLRIVYTDETVAEGRLEDWPSFRSEGVDTVRIGDEVFSGNAIYWLYKDEKHEPDAWVFGMASTYVSPPPPETVFRNNGNVGQRNIVTMPDLLHSQVKLGWWKRPTAEKPYEPGAGKA